MHEATLCYLIRNGHICLPIKKNGVVAGKRTGYGGKINWRESTREATVRELKEESGGTIVKPENLVESGQIKFIINGHFEWFANVFFVYFWENEPKETEEMGKPDWFQFGKIPWDELPQADRYWLPIMLAGQKIKATAHYGETPDEFISFECFPYD